jgi:hypothetical protein
MDENISAQFRNNYVLTLDLTHARTWRSPVPADGADSRHTEREK